MNIFELAAKIKLDTSEYESGIAGAQKKTSGFANSLKGGLKVAGATAVAATAAITAGVVAVSGAMKKGIQQTAAYGDNVDKMSQKMNITAEAYQEWDFVMQHCGASIDSLKPSMKTLASAAETNSKAFDALGISQEEVAKMSQEELFSKTISSLQGVTDETQRTYLASQLLGRGATELGALLNMTAEETAAMTKQAHELGGVMSDEAVKASAAFDDSLQNLQTVLHGLSRGIFSEFLPASVSVLDGLTAVFSGDSGGVAKVNEGIRSIVDNLTKMMPEIIKMGGEILVNLSQAIIENLPVLFDGMLPVVLAIAHGIIEYLPQLGQTAITIVMSVVNGIINNLPALIEASVQMIQQLVDALTNPETLTQLLNAAVAILEALAIGIVENLPALIDAAVALIMNLYDFILAPENIETILKLAFEIIGALVVGLIKAVPKLLQGVGEIYGKLFEKLGELGKEFVNIGKNIVQGIWDGIKGMWGKLTAWFSEKWENLVGGVKDFLGIHSPSRVFAGIGKNMALGLGEGWEDEFDKVADDIDGGLDFASNADITAMPLLADAAGGAAFGGNTDNSIVMNIYGAVGQDVNELATIIEQKIATRMNRRTAVYG